MSVQTPLGPCLAEPKSIRRTRGSPLQYNPRKGKNDFHMIKLIHVVWFDITVNKRLIMDKSKSTKKLTQHLNNKIKTNGKKKTKDQKKLWILKAGKIHNICFVL
jgi:hypothetical protein